MPSLSGCASRVVRLNVTNQDLGTAAALDPTHLFAIPAAHASKYAMEESREKMTDDMLKQLPPQQREFMKRQMKGEISDDEFKRELFKQYGLDEDGNPLPSES